MRNLKLILEYDGGCFAGFQVQPKRQTVQGELEKALQKVTGESIRVNGAGRTDAGVHAVYQVVNFRASSRLSVIEIKRALNSYLKNIMVKDVAVAALSFDARRCARKREYVYLIYNGEDLPVFLNGKVSHVRAQLDLSRMKKASKALVGKHDFSSFCARDKHKKNCNRTVDRISISRKTLKLFDHGCVLICIKIIADGFLWKMVRFIVGTLLRVGKGKLRADDVDKILSLKNNMIAGPVAPAQGLYLTNIRY